MRIQYIKRHRGYRKYVIVDFDELGQPHFADHEMGSTQWYPYTASIDEQDQALRLAAACQNTNGWATCIEID